MTISVLVADDHAIIRDGLRKILADTEDLVVAGEAADGNAALELVRSQEWDVMLMDLSMPGRHGIELIKLVKADRPKLPILIFSMHPEEQFAVRSIRAGASGYLSKESDSNLLVPAIRKVAAGGVFISPKVAELLATDVSPRAGALPHTQLSDREFEVFGEIVRGTSLTDIAAKLSLSIKTVSTHKSNILVKMNLTSTVELFRYAIEHELLDLTRE